MSAALPRRALVIDDQPIQSNLLARPLRRAIPGWEVDEVTNRAAGMARLAQADPYTVVFVDYNLEAVGHTGADVVEEIAGRYPDIVIIGITGESTAEVAVRMYNAGAHSYINRPFETSLLLAMVEAYYKKAASGQLTRAASTPDGRELVKEFQSGEVQQFIGAGPRMEAMFRRIRRYARSPFPILIVGESGTGKELVARRIHMDSGRGAQIFRPINSGAIPADLVESELFGHKKGAFTNALHDYAGMFRAATKGTLFLDEINSLPLPAQVKLLRAIQNREVTALGSNEPTQIETRVVAASNADLKAAVEAGTFRQDLYHRLAIFVIEIPPLRDRREDIPKLMWHFIQTHQKVWGLNIKGVHPHVPDILQAHDWRANNVRELEAVVLRALATAAYEGLSELTPELLEIDGANPTPLPRAPDDPANPWEDLLDQPYAEAQQQLRYRFGAAYWRAIMVAANMEIAQAAIRSGVSPTNIYAQLDKYGLRAWFDESRDNPRSPPTKGGKKRP